MKKVLSLMFASIILAVSSACMAQSQTEKHVKIYCQIEGYEGKIWVNFGEEDDLEPEMVVIKNRLEAKYKKSPIGAVNYLSKQGWVLEFAFKSNRNSGLVTDIYVLSKEIVLSKNQ